MFTLLFGDYTFPNQTFEVQGFPIKNAIKENAVPRAHGSIIPTPFLKSRSFRIRGFIHNASNEDSLTQLLAMQRALLAGEKEFYSRGDRYIKARADEVEASPAKGTDGAVLECDIRMIASVPFFYSAGASYSAGFTVTGTTYNFDVYSGGNVFAEPVIYFYASGGTITDNIKLTNTSNGNELLRYRGTLPAGATLKVDADTLEVLVNGADGLSNFEGDFLSLVAGTSTFQYVGGDCRLTVEHKYRWYD